MKTLDKIKYKMEKLRFAKINLQSSKDLFENRVVLFNKARGTNLHRKAFDLKEVARKSWYNDIDKVNSLEVELNNLKNYTGKKLIVLT